VRPSSRTRVYALLGNPVSHSLSPALHNAAFHAAGVDAVYVALQCAAEHVGPMMRTLAGAGGGGNVTVPHKTVAASFAEPGSVVAAIGAANVFASVDDTLLIGNGDVEGVTGSVTKLGIAATTWLVIGTGGSARAIAIAAREAGAALAVISRSPERASAFRVWAASAGVAPAEVPEATLVLNATPLGLAAGDASPIAPAALPSVRGAIDLTYRSIGTTAWCEEWSARGIPAIDGREMLLIQAVASWRHWFSGVEAPIPVMRAVLHGQLG